jgi:hypothetical protein
MGFATAFGLETLVYSKQAWARLSVGIALAVMLFLILWCIWMMIEAWIGFSLLEIVRSSSAWVVESTWGFGGNTPEPGQDNGDSKGERVKLPLFRWRRRSSRSSSLVGVDATRDKGLPGQPDNV